MNKVELSGTLFRVNPIKYTASGFSILNASVCISKKKKDGGYDNQYFSLVFFGELAEKFKEGTKGTPIEIKGELRSSSWLKKDGTKGYKTEVIVHDGVLGPIASPQPESERKPAPKIGASFQDSFGNDAFLNENNDVPF